MTLSPPINSRANLRSRHTFGFDVDGHEVHEFQHLNELIDLLDKFPNALVIGEGSNTIFLEDFEAPLLINHIPEKKIFPENNTAKVVLGSGENWHDAVMWSLQQGLHGLENLALIPGTCGAAPVQNIGAYGKELSDHLLEVHAIDRKNMTPTVITKDRCELGYRQSLFKNHPNRYVITSITLELSKHPIPHLQYGELKKMISPSSLEIAQKVISIREQKLPDPQTLGNAGSFFKNPIVSKSLAQRILADHSQCPIYPAPGDQNKLSAAWLIDQCGFRGQRLGDIGCHENQALVLVNFGEGAPRDLIHFIHAIREKVNSTFGILLETEVQLMTKQGRWTP